MNTKGVIYIATGSQHRSEAASNLERSLPFLKSFSSCIYTDDTSDPNISAFDIILQHPCPTFSYRDKVSPLSNFPFDYNLFLDSDAFLVYNPIALFDLLNYFDFVASYAPVRHPPGWTDSEIPLTFPEYNSGVMLLKRGRPCRRLLRDWLRLYDQLNKEYSQNWDQASLRSAVWRLLKRNSIKPFVLPPECNLRTTKPWSMGRGMPAFVIHGRIEPLEIFDFVRYLNDDIDRFRFWSEWLELFPNSSIRPRHDRTFK